MGHKKSFLLFQSLLSMSIFIIGIGFEQYLVLILIVIPCYFIFKQKYNLKTYLLISIFWITAIILILFIPKEWKLINIANFINNNIENDLREISINHLENIYSSESLSFLKLLLFNEKDFQNDTFILFKDLGILHLFVVSGLHVSIVTCIFNKIFYKNKTIAKITNLILCSLLWYFSNFSLSILRIIIILVISFFKYFKSYSNFFKNCIAGIFVCVFFVRDASSYSFILTWICTLLINYICEKTESNVLKYILINITIFFVTLPIIIKLNGSFNLIGFINNFGFSWLIMFIYIFELIFVWIPPIADFNSLLIINTINFFESLLALQPIIKTSINEYLIISIYAIILMFFNWKWHKEINAKESILNYNSLYVKN